MTSNQPIPVLVMLLGLLAAREAQAFYNPSTGRWLNRDPIEETSFRQRVESTESRLGNAGMAIVVSVSTGRALAQGVYVVSRNEVLSSVDYLGLLPVGQATRTIPDCAIEIYAGHGFRADALDDEGKLKHPDAVDRLKYPHILKGTKCSAGAIIACNAKSFARVDNLITGFELPGEGFKEYEGAAQITRAVEAASGHAANICKQCCRCQRVSISVNCTAPFTPERSWYDPRGWFHEISNPHCGKTYVVACSGQRGGR